VGAIRDPITLFHEQRSMLETPAIQALASNDAKDLHGLLKVFQEGKLQDYRNFPNKEAVLSKYGLEDDCCTRHMRILSLCSLTAEMEEVPYEMVAQTLDVIPTEVESWVIQAVSSGLISAKMDQMHKRIMVERSVVRNFDLKQWKALQTQLQSWRDHVQSIIDALKQADISSANN
jgi:translation initiation factor 3 subunit M